MISFGLKQQDCLIRAQLHRLLALPATISPISAKINVASHLTKISLYSDPASAGSLDKFNAITGGSSYENRECPPIAQRMIRGSVIAV